MLILKSDHEQGGTGMYLFTISCKKRNKINLKSTLSKSRNKRYCLTTIKLSYKILVQGNNHYVFIFLILYISVRSTFFLLVISIIIKKKKKNTNSEVLLSYDIIINSLLAVKAVLTGPVVDMAQREDPRVSERKVSPEGLALRRRRGPHARLLQGLRVRVLIQEFARVVPRVLGGLVGYFFAAAVRLHERFGVNGVLVVLGVVVGGCYDRGRGWGRVLRDSDAPVSAAAVVARASRDAVVQGVRPELLVLIGSRRRLQR